MKLSKKTKATLRRRKLAYFRWPAAFPPRHDGIYKIGKDSYFRVITFARKPEGFEVAAVMADVDPYRLRPRSVGQHERVKHEGAYEEQPIHVLRDGPIPEPEAVDFAYQQRFRDEAQMKDQERMGEYVAAMEDVKGAIEQRVAASPGLKRQVGRELAQIRGHVDDAKRKLEERQKDTDLDAAA